MTNEIFSLESIANMYKLVEKEYFIAAIENNGGRYYSELISGNELCVRIQDCVDIVQYFGGGIVTVYKKEKNDCNIIKIYIVK